MCRHLQPNLPQCNPYYNLEYNLWYHFKVRSNGGEVEFYLDSSFVLSHSSVQFGSGYIGLKTMYESTAYFDNILISTSDPTDADSDNNQGLQYAFIFLTPIGIILMFVIFFKFIKPAATERRK